MTGRTDQSDRRRNSDGRGRRAAGEALEPNWLGADHQKYMFIYDEAGRLIWYPDRTYIGQTMDGDVLEFVAEHNRLDSRELAVYYRTCQNTRSSVPERAGLHHLYRGH